MSGPRGEGGRRDARLDVARSSHPDPRHRGWSLPGCLRSGGTAGRRQRTAHSGQEENSQRQAEGGEGGAEGGRQKEGRAEAILPYFIPSITHSLKDRQRRDRSVRRPAFQRCVPRALGRTRQPGPPPIGWKLLGPGMTISRAVILGRDLYLLLYVK
jgi:hypothetical protein